MIGAEFKIVIATLRNLHGVFGRLWIVREQSAHLGLVLQIELLRLKTQPLWIVHGLPRLDAHEDVLIFGILFFNIVGIVRDDDGDAGFVVNAKKAPGGFLFLRKAVVLKLQIKILRPEQVRELQCFCLGTLVIAASDHSGMAPATQPDRQMSPSCRS